MAENPNLTEQKLAELRDTFKQKVEEVKKTPDQLNDTVDDLKWVAPAIYWKITGTRDDIQEKLKELFAKLEEAVEGMYAPWLFVDYASKWQVVGTRVGSVKSAQASRELNMEGQWDGSAYKSFKTTKESQEKAMAAIIGLCEKIHDQLLIVAEEGRNLYLNIIKHLGTIIGEIGVFIAETPESLGVAAVWTINNLNSAVVAAVDLVVEAIADFLETNTKAYIASNELTNMIRSPEGIDVSVQGKPHWPNTVSDQFDNKDDDWHLDGEDK